MLAMLVGRGILIDLRYVNTAPVDKWGVDSQMYEKSKGKLHLGKKWHLIKFILFALQIVQSNYRWNFIMQFYIYVNYLSSS